MENNWPETVDELLEECQRLINKNDLYTLGERGEPFSGETNPRVDGTEYLAGEYQYGVAMVPAQWVTHVIDAATLGSGTCELKQASWDDGSCTWGCVCSACDAHFEHETGIGYNYCPNCGAKVVSE